MTQAALPVRPDTPSEPIIVFGPPTYFDHLTKKHGVATKWESFIPLPPSPDSVKPLDLKRITENPSGLTKERTCETKSGNLTTRVIWKQTPVMAVKQGVKVAPQSVKTLQTHPYYVGSHGRPMQGYTKQWQHTLLPDPETLVAHEAVQCTEESITFAEEGGEPVRRQILNTVVDSEDLQLCEVAGMDSSLLEFFKTPTEEEKRIYRQASQHNLFEDVSMKERIEFHRNITQPKEIAMKNLRLKAAEAQLELAQADLELKHHLARDHDGSSTDNSECNEIEEKLRAYIEARQTTLKHLQKETDSLSRSLVAQRHYLQKCYREKCVRQLKLPSSIALSCNSKTTPGRLERYYHYYEQQKISEKYDKEINAEGKIVRKLQIGEYLAFTATIVAAIAVIILQASALPLWALGVGACALVGLIGTKYFQKKAAPHEERLTRLQSQHMNYLENRLRILCLPAGTPSDNVAALDLAKKSTAPEKRPAAHPTEGKQLKRYALDLG